MFPITSSVDQGRPALVLPMNDRWAGSVLDGISALGEATGFAARRAGSALELAENAGEVSAVCLAEPAEDPFGLGSAGRADRVEDARAVLGQLDEGGPPIGGTAPPLRPAPGIRVHHDPRGRRRPDTPR